MNAGATPWVSSSSNPGRELSVSVREVSPVESLGKVVEEALYDGSVVAWFLRHCTVGQHPFSPRPGPGRLLHPAQAHHERAGQNAMSVEFLGAQVVRLFAEDLGGGSTLERGTSISGLMCSMGASPLA